MESLLTAEELATAVASTAAGERLPKGDATAVSDVRRKLRNLVQRADCMKFMKKLPDNVIDGTITSPPYNKMNKFISYNSFDDSLPWDEYQESQIAVLTELYRITKPGGHLWYVHKVQHYQTFIMHPVEWLSRSPWTIQNEITWHRRSCVNCNPYRFREVDERIYWLTKPGPKPFELSTEVSKWGTVWFTPDDRKAMLHAFHIHHPATYNLYLVLAMLHAMNLPTGSLIYDPYGGTGTTAKACQALNQYYLTTEFDREYVKAIRMRLATRIEADEYFILVFMKQIMTQTLDLSRNFRLSQLHAPLLVEPWEVPDLKSEQEFQEECLERNRKKPVYFRKYPSLSYQKTAKRTYRVLYESSCRSTRKRPRSSFNKNRRRNTPSVSSRARLKKRSKYS